MKIAIIKKVFLGIGGGGAEKYAQNICKELIQKKHTIYIISEYFDAEEHDKLIHLPVSKKKFFSTSGTTRFHKNVQKIIPVYKKKYNFDIIYALSRTYPADIFRVTEQVHVEWLKIGYPKYQKYNCRHRGILKLEKNICNDLSINKIITNSEIAKKQIASNYNCNLKKIHVIRNGVDRNNYYPSIDNNEKVNIRKRFYLKRNLESKLILLFVATNYKIKGLKQAIETLAILPQEIRDKTLLFVIGNDNKKPYIQIAQKNNIEDKILFLGQQDNIRDYYAASDLLFFPSLGEPFANTCLEAFACGLPVLTTALNGSSEIITHNKNGYVIPTPFTPKNMAEYITRYYNLSDKERVDFSKSAYNASLKYSWQKHVNHLEELFNEIKTQKAY